MFRDGALESELVSGNNSFLRRPKLNPAPETEKQFLDEVARAMALADARLRANPNDVPALYAEGISYGLLSNYYWVVKKSWRDSLKDATNARRLHNRVSELQPGNVDARLVQGLHDYIVGSLPLAFRMLGFLAGIHGDKEKGIREVQDVAQNGKDNRIDAQIFLCALYRRENQPRKAIPLVQDLIRRYPRNFLLRMELAQMYSVAGDGASALSALQEVARMKTSHAPGYDRVPWEKIYFQEGTIQFWYRDLNGALENMKKVTAPRRTGPQHRRRSPICAWGRSTTSRTAARLPWRPTKRPSPTRPTRKPRKSPRNISPRPTAACRRRDDQSSTETLTGNSINFGSLSGGQNHQRHTARGLPGNLELDGGGGLFGDIHHEGRSCRRSGRAWRPWPSAGSGPWR